MPQTFVKRSRIAAPAERVFDWHMRPQALAELTPPWEPVEIVERTGGGIDDIGSRVVLRVGRWPLRTRLVAEHTHFEPGRMFRDVLVQSPFARWEHTHLVEPDGPGACWLEDRIVYALPFGALGRMLGGWFVRRKLERMFDYRHRVTAEAVLRNGPTAARG
jgi:ligand-binding SRPBCC domain-containing protein